MTNTWVVDGRTLTFPEDWTVSKFDEWAYYLNQFQSQQSGYKAVDLLAVSPDRCLYLIEVKDYLIPGTPKPSNLPEVVAKKVVDTLAALIPAAIHANNSDERALAGLARKCRSIRVVLHCELPRRHMPVIDPTALSMRLTKLVRAIDPHAVVVDSRTLHLPWAVASTRTPASS